MRNTASEDSAEWNWAKSTGLQPNEDHCLLETRHHLRYFSSDDNGLTHDPLGGDVGGYGYWVVIAAHHEDPGFLLDHDIRPDGWEGGELRVLQSMMTPDPNVMLDWLEEVEPVSFRNSRGSDGTFPEDVEHNGQGFVIKIGSLPSREPIELAKPSPPTVVAAGNSIIVSKPTAAVWFDYTFKGAEERVPFRPFPEAFLPVEVVDKFEDRVTIPDLSYQALYQVKVRAYTKRARSEYSDWSGEVRIGPVCTFAGLDVRGYVGARRSGFPECPVNRPSRPT